ncbi:hypothetical protein RFI_23194 [Reticulomyxa filosa]|uniref:Uncharacterized protein n=1 Tax=Reticulomyxa filosa TaxID=46433 RepID=X6MJI7_RETFI|nr:hypothetical protein RFI_23194 [Reticulomyxa filosa]|eukprot:ETO14178.1 hypothetical protein RFI_23194 [Reticulomyxa filosa]
MYFNDENMINLVKNYLKYHHQKNNLSGDAKKWTNTLLNKLVMVEKADLFRYIAIYIHGGVYVDSDVICKVPIEHWLLRYSDTLGNISLEDVDMIVGIEFLKRHGPNPFQLVQWTFAARRHSPILKAVIDICIRYIMRGRYISDVLQRTGPGMFTHAVLTYIIAKSTSHKYGRSTSDYLPYPFHVIHPMEQLDRTGQILILRDRNTTSRLCILPYRAFGIFDEHQSVNKLPASQQLVQHLFDASWMNRSFH